MIGRKDDGWVVDESVIVGGTDGTGGTVGNVLVQFNMNEHESHLITQPMDYRIKLGMFM